jgi:hypothetical protein
MIDACGYSLDVKRTGWGFDPGTTEDRLHSIVLMQRRKGRTRSLSDLTDPAKENLFESDFLIFS